jgi:hypothetical protein
MSKQESSAIRLGSVTVNTEPYRGERGATGPTGPTGATGPVGNPGPRGIGVSTILRNGADGVTIFLTDNSTITLKGLSGNTFTDYASVSQFYSVVGSTGIVSNESFEIKGAVQGLTATFKPVYFIGGLTSNYSGALQQDIKISGVDSNTRIGLPGNILIGVTNDVTEGINPNIFKYEENTVGITTIAVLKAKLTSFTEISLTHTQNKNWLSRRSFPTRNAWPLNDIVSGNTSGIYFPTLIMNTSNSGITVFDTLSTEHGKVKTGKFTRRINFRTELRGANDGSVVYQSAIGRGSCCYCDGTGERRCKDFVDKLYCTSSVVNGGLNGTFSFKSCEQRKTSDCTAIGKCCIGGICLDLERGECLRLGGTHTAGSLCANRFDC